MRYTIDFAEDDGIVTCRLFGMLIGEAARRLATDVLAAMETVRSQGRPLLYLVDNRAGRVASPAIATSLADRLAAARRPGDRIAIVVPDSLSKLQAKHFALSGHGVFLSENAARTWLTAYAASPPPSGAFAMGRGDVATSSPPA